MSFCILFGKLIFLYTCILFVCYMSVSADAETLYFFGTCTTCCTCSAGSSGAKDSCLLLSMGTSMAFVINAPAAHVPNTMSASSYKKGGFASAAPAWEPFLSRRGRNMRSHKRSVYAGPHALLAAALLRSRRASTRGARGTATPSKNARWRAGSRRLALYDALGRAAPAFDIYGHSGSAHALMRSTMLVFDVAAFVVGGGESA